MADLSASAVARSDKTSLLAEFGRYFELSLALTEAQKAEVFSVRYHVYCEEFGYEDAQAFADGLEKDVYDDRSLHCLVTHKASNRPAGCVRLVTASDTTQLPFEVHCGDALDSEFMSSMNSHRHTIAELSRLAVDGAFRRRRGEHETRFGNVETLNFAAKEQRTFPLITIFLFLASFSVADLIRRRDCFAIMEPFLPVILRRTGIIVKRVGDDFDFRGVRAPYYLHIGDAVRGFPDELRQSYDAIKHQFAEILTPEGQREVSRLPSGNSSRGAMTGVQRLPLRLAS